MRRGLIVIVYTSVGAGHARAAEAVREALRRLDPPLEAEVVDALKHAPGWFRLAYGGGYNWLAGHWPGLYGFLYRMTNPPPRWYQRPVEWLRVRLECRGTRALARHLADRQPLFLVSTHVLFGPHVGSEFARLLDQVRQVVVVTDNEAHRCWLTPGAERYFVNSEDVVNDLAALGVDRERTTVTGIPIHPVWDESCEPAEVKARWNLPADRRIVMLVGGSRFTVGPFERIVRRLAEANPDIHVLAITGRNRRVYERLRNYSQSKCSVSIIEHTDRLHELLSAASLLVTKPGGLMTSESLAKGVPMILVNPIPGQEVANARYLTRHKAARFVRRPRDVPAVVNEVLRTPGMLEQMQAAARSLARPGAHTIAVWIQDWIATREV